MSPSWCLTFFFITAIFSAVSSRPQNGPPSEAILKSPPQIIHTENSTAELVDLNDNENYDDAAPPLSAGIPVPGLEESDETLEALNATINREKRTLGVLSRFYCSIFYRNSPSDCPVGRRWRTDNDITVSTADKQTQDDFWLNYLGNNGTNSSNGDAVFIPTTESTNYNPQTPTKSGILGILFPNARSGGSHPIRNTFRVLFPRLSGYFSPGDASSSGGYGLDGDAVGSDRTQRVSWWTRIVNWWSRLVKRFQRLRAGYRGFRDGYRNYGSSDSVSGEPSSPRTGGLDISGLLQNIDLSALLQNFQT